MFSKGENKRNLARFRKADDAAMYFFGKLYRFPNFRRAYVAIGVNSRPHPMQMSIARLFGRWRQRRASLRRSFRFQGMNGKDRQLSVEKDADGWRVNGKSDWIGSFDVYADALVFPTGN